MPTFKYRPTEHAISGDLHISTFNSQENSTFDKGMLTSDESQNTNHEPSFQAIQKTSTVILKKYLCAIAFEKYATTCLAFHPVWPANTLHRSKESLHDAYTSYPLVKDKVPPSTIVR